MCNDFTIEFIGLSSFTITDWWKESESHWVVQLDPTTHQVDCPICFKRSSNHARPGRRMLRHRHILGWGDVSVCVPIWRQRCDHCALTFTVEWDGIPIRGSVTDSFRQLAVKQCHGRDLQSVSRELNIRYSTLERWYYTDAPRGLPDPAYHAPPDVLCMDEFALRKGHRYGLNLMDARSGHVWQVTSGRSRSQIRAALQAWPFVSPPQVIVTDLAPGMADTVRSVWPETTVVADKFHVFQLFGKSLEQKRKLSTFRGTQHRGRHEQRLLHKPMEQLQETEQDELKAWLASDPGLKELHTALQEFRAIYADENPERGVRAFERWLRNYLYSTSAVVRRIAKTLIQWQDEIKAYFTYPYTNARIEGTHNRIKVLKRRAYGYRNMERFAIRIRLECHSA